MNDIACFENTPIDDNLFQSILSRVDEVEELTLRNCKITNKMVDKMSKQIKEKKKPVIRNNIRNNY